MSGDDDVLVVGGGVIGLASALALLQAGRGVRVLEAGVAGCGSSHGNCGTITPSHAAPLPAPGAVGQALRWMFTPDAPFYLKPRLDPALWHWLARFGQRCNGRDWRASMHAKAELLNLSRAMFPQWTAEHAPGCEFVESGVDYIFRDAAALDHFGGELEALRDVGVHCEHISPAAYASQEPALREGLAGVVRFPGDARLRPDTYVAGLAQAVRAAGGVITEHCEVLALDSASARPRLSTSHGEFHGRDVVIATGAWSPRLARALGLASIPIQPGKGYSITYDRPTLAPRRPLVLVERSVCVTAWDSGYRLGSTMEFSGYDDTLNRRRLAALERGAAEYLHQPVGPVKREEWFGWRPMTWDDLPIIGPVPGQPRICLATGHGMLGVSMSPATARLVADLVCDREPAIDPAPYAATRFASGRRRSAPLQDAAA
jgi:D-amino-acid dehydrogenase